MSSPAEKARLPFVVLLLALGTFLTATTEFVIAGLLPEIASDLSVGVSQAGLLITAFAIGMIVGAPALSIATLRLPKRSTLVLALAVFSAGHVIAALSTSFTIVLVARMITALATGTFLAVAAVVATKAAGPSAASRAMGVVMGGVGLATVVGVPLGSWAGQLMGWRGVFWLLAALSAAAAVVIGRFVPAEENSETPSLRGQANALRAGRLWLVLAATALVASGFMAAFSYITPLLTARTGISEGIVPLVLAGFGVGALAGTNLGGRFGDRRPLATFITSAVSTALILVALIPLSTSVPVTVALVVLLGMTGMAVTSIATPMAVGFAPAAPALAAALAVSAFNVGIAGGSWGAGRTLDSALGTTGPELLGAVMVAAGLLPLLTLAALRTRRTTAATPDPTPQDDGSLTATESAGQHATV